MGDVYRVSIVRESGSGEKYETETVFEVAGGIGMVVKLAPGALVDALRAAHEEGMADAAPLAERVMDAAAAAGAPVLPSSHPFQDAQPVKRSRRTKAQIAADDEAKALGYRDAAQRAEAEAAAVAPQATPPAQPEATPEGPIVPVQGTPTPSPGEGPAEVIVPPAGAGAGAPFNPFEVK